MAESILNWEYLQAKLVGGPGDFRKIIILCIFFLKISCPFPHPHPLHGSAVHETAAKRTLLDNSEIVWTNYLMTYN